MEEVEGGFRWIGCHSRDLRHSGSGAHMRVHVHVHACVHVRARARVRVRVHVRERCEGTWRWGHVEVGARGGEGTWR